VQVGNPSQIAERYLAVWNEADAERRRALVAATFTDDAAYADPRMRADGHAGLDAMIAAAREQFPGHRFTLRGEPEGFDGRVRFSWSLAADGAAAVAHGTDVAVVAADGRLESVTGFLDIVDAPAATAPTPSSDHATPAYAIGHLRDVRMGPDILEYLRRIDETLAPFGGRFAIHGATPEILEGDWTGDLIAIRFPDPASARAWYGSPAYQEIIPLRTGSATGDVILVDGVPEGHRATDILARGEDEEPVPQATAENGTRGAREAVGARVQR
jgi:uncharacterized protein (DUF1330 family)